MSDAPTLIDYLNGIKTGIATLVPALTSIEVSRGRLSLNDLSRRMVKPPAARIGLLRLADFDRVAEAEVRMNAQVSILLIFEQKGRTEMHDQAHGLVSGLAVSLFGRNLGIDYAGSIIRPDFKNLFSGEADSRGVLVWEITFQQQVTLSAEALTEGAVPTDLYVGYAPDVGEDHRADYHHITTGEPPPEGGAG